MEEVQDYTQMLLAVDSEISKESIELLKLIISSPASELFDKIIQLKNNK